jgi:hypothetical protein
MARQAADVAPNSAAHLRQYVGRVPRANRADYQVGGHVLGTEIVVGHDAERAIRDGNATVSLEIESRSLSLIRKSMHVGGRYQGRFDR